MTPNMRTGIEEAIRVDGGWLAKKMKAYNTKVISGEIDTELDRIITESCEWFCMDPYKMEIKYDYIDYNCGDNANPLWVSACLYKSFKVKCEYLEVKFEVEFTI